MIDSIFGIGATLSDAEAYRQYIRVYESLLGTGMNIPIAKLAAAQAVHETDRFSSRAYNELNNASGIKQLNGKAYRKYDSIEKWADHLYKILKINKGIGAPINAKDISDYAHRLKYNGYYEDSESNYKRGLNNGLKFIENISTPGLIEQNQNRYFENARKGGKYDKIDKSGYYIDATGNEHYVNTDGVDTITKKKEPIAGWKWLLGGIAVAIGIKAISK